MVLFVKISLSVYSNSVLSEILLSLIELHTWYGVPLSYVYYGDPLLAGWIVKQQKGRKHTPLIASVWFKLIVLAGLITKHTEPKSNTA